MVLLGFRGGGGRYKVTETGWANGAAGRERAWRRRTAPDRVAEQETEPV